MTDSVRTRFVAWHLADVLRNFPGLCLVPTAADGLKLAGMLAFSAVSPPNVQIEDEYEIEILIPRDFPRVLPSVREPRGRIPPTHHKLSDGSLCLGAPTRLRLAMGRSSSIGTFIERCVIPYLYAYSHLERFGSMPFGELRHGVAGLCDDLTQLFGVNAEWAVRSFVELAAKRKRVANKCACACGSGRRLGQCHHRRVNRMRATLGRTWFRSVAYSLGDTARR